MVMNPQADQWHPASTGTSFLSKESNTIRTSNSPLVSQYNNGIPIEKLVFIVGLKSSLKHYIVARQWQHSGYTKPRYSGPTRTVTRGQSRGHRSKTINHIKWQISHLFTAEQLGTSELRFIHNLFHVLSCKVYHSGSFFLAAMHCLSQLQIASWGLWPLGGNVELRVMTCGSTHNFATATTFPSQFIPPMVSKY